MGGGRRTENYFQCLTARNWDSARASRIQYAVKGEFQPQTKSDLNIDFSNVNNE